MNEPGLDALRRKAALAVLAWFAQAFYVLFPFDLLPDFIPVIGWMDDAVALAGLVATTVWMVRTVQEIGLDRLLPGTAPATLDKAESYEPYEPIPTDILRAL